MFNLLSTGWLIRHRVFCWHTEYYKAPYLYQNLGLSNSLISLCDPKKHKIHRSVVTPLFTKQSIDRLSSCVVDKVEDAVELMRQCNEQGKPVDIQLLYRCITVSRISIWSLAQIPRSKDGGSNLHAWKLMHGTTRLTSSRSLSSAFRRIFSDPMTGTSLLWIVSMCSRKALL